MASFFIRLWRFPNSLTRIRIPFLLTALVVVLAPTWLTVTAAITMPQVTLVETLPSVPAALFRLAIALPILLPPARLAWLLAGVWSAIAIPVLGYLLAHPAELQTPRGTDFVLALGPGFGIALAIVIFYAHLQAAIERLHAERQHWQRRSEQDALTGLYNRGTGEQRLQQLWAQAEQPLVAIIFDLDHFKAVN
ncbi:MAG: GGDEF domain-containing protein, partial [Spirulinaceae cyanobacterium RM2_2_10]|nr:GGDEF domain-containing protein [Spirulinaceae cyanobacterium RM2_2_10]